ncbi:MAG: V-type ATP synthase subunit D [Bacteroidales bacterium]|nr:V-type ATP synthase subunit D [Bacteroidales bacterium]
MAIKFQYNKISLQNINKQLNIRTKALPILKNKEAALRTEVKRARDEADKFEKELASIVNRYGDGVRLWSEFDSSLLSVKEIKTDFIKIAGITIPEFRGITFTLKPFNLYESPAWFAEGIKILKEMANALAKRDLMREKMGLLDHARKKTTQKVNLYEKVQIPGYEDAIRRIKRFLEDEENLSKSAQKIIKARQEEQTEKNGTE